MGPDEIPCSAGVRSYVAICADIRYTPGASDAESVSLTPSCVETFPRDFDNSLGLYYNENEPTFQLHAIVVILQFNPTITRLN